MHIKTKVGTLISQLRESREETDIDKLAKASGIPFVHGDELHSILTKHPNVLFLDNKKRKLKYRPEIASVGNKEALIAYVRTNTGLLDKQQLEDCYAGAKEDVDALLDGNFLLPVSDTKNKKVYFIYNFAHTFEEKLSKSVLQKLAGASLSVGKTELVEELKKRRVLRPEYGQKVELDTNRLKELKKKLKLTF